MERAAAPHPRGVGGAWEHVVVHGHHHRDEHHGVVEQVQLEPREPQLHDARGSWTCGATGWSGGVGGVGVWGGEKGVLAMRNVYYWPPSCGESRTASPPIRAPCSLPRSMSLR